MNREKIDIDQFTEMDMQNFLAKLPFSENSDFKSILLIFLAILIVILMIIMVCARTVSIIFLNKFVLLEEGVFFVKYCFRLSFHDVLL